MTESISGSLEILSNGESAGVVGISWNDETVPVVLGALYGITDMEKVEPDAAETGRVPDGQWTAKSVSNQAVTVRLWREIPHEETYAAKIGPGLAEEG